MKIYQPPRRTVDFQRITVEPTADARHMLATIQDGWIGKDGREYVAKLACVICRPNRLSVYRARRHLERWADRHRHLQTLAEGLHHTHAFARMGDGEA